MDSGSQRDQLGKLREGQHGLQGSEHTLYPSVTGVLSNPLLSLVFAQHMPRSSCF